MSDDPPVDDPNAAGGDDGPQVHGPDAFELPTGGIYRGTYVLVPKPATNGGDAGGDAGSRLRFKFWKFFCYKKIKVLFETFISYYLSQYTVILPADSTCFLGRTLILTE
jgi:hypothetical protein